MSDAFVGDLVNALENQLIVAAIGLLMIAIL
jgi:hypothetical protein